MRLKGFLVFLLLIFCDYGSFAQIQGELTQSRILILLDESSSMTQSWSGGKPKYKAADEVILRLMDSMYAVNNQIEFSLRVFGHQHTVAENDCYDTKNEVAFSRDNRTQMAFRLDDIKPLGVTPIAYALEQAAEHDLVDEAHNAYSIILLTDGGESCGGDICDVMKKLLKSKVYFKPYIVSLENDPALKTTYACMGDYLQVTKDDDIPRAVNTIVQAFRPIIKITPAEYKQMQTIATSAPSILKVNIPNVKVTDTTTPAPPVPEHKIKVEEAPKAPPQVAKVDHLALARLSVLNVNILPTHILKLVTPGSLPPIVAEVPPAPPVVIPAPEKITHLAPSALKKFNTYDQYTTRIKLNTVDPGALPPLVIETPPPPPVVEIKLPPAEKIAHSPIAQLKKLDVNISNTLKLHTVQPPALPPVVSEPPPPPPVVAITIPPAEKIAHAALAHTKKLDINIPNTPLLKTVKTPPLPALVFEVPPAPVVAPPAPPVVEVPKHVAEKIARLKLIAINTIKFIVVIDEHGLSARRVPPLPPVKYEAPPKVAVTKGGKIPVEAPAGKKMDYTVESENAKESSLEVYITNGKGTFYSTNPLIALVDPATKKVVKQFYRYVDPNGNPDPQKNIPVGTYNLTFPEKKDLVITNVHIEPNKKTKIIVKVTDVSLYFYYSNNKDRPVEGIAKVIERDKPKGRVQDQLCITKLQYEPGNYHIRINTFPETVRNVDLDLEAETGIGIPEPGFIKFTSDTKQVVTLWMQDGDRFKPFHQLDLNDPVSQHLQIQPGQYQVHFRKGPGGPAASEKVISFIVKSNETTEVPLK